MVADGTWIRQHDLAEVGEYYGLVIGVDEYGPAEWKLRCAVRDAKAVAKLLRDEYGFRDIVELYDRDATLMRRRSAATSTVSVWLFLPGLRSNPFWKRRDDVSRNA